MDGKRYADMKVLQLGDIGRSDGADGDRGHGNRRFLGVKEVKF